MRRYLAKKFFGDHASLTPAGLILFDVLWMTLLWGGCVSISTFKTLSSIASRRSIAEICFISDPAPVAALLTGQGVIIAICLLRIFVKTGLCVQHFPRIDGKLFAYRENFFMKSWFRVFLCVAGIFVALPLSYGEGLAAGKIFVLLTYPLMASICSFLLFGTFLAAIQPKIEK